MMEKLQKISTMYYLRQIAACLLVYGMLLAVPAQVAQATPSGGTFDVGTGTIVDGVQNSTVTVDQVQSVINWNSLDTIGTPLIDRETLTFLQNIGITNAAVLNRVISGGATNFNGELSAVGMHIFIVNTRGIVFGPESFIQARNFVASGIDIQNDNFINGIYRFEKFEPTEGNPYSDWIGNVTNEGIGIGHGINAENVALIGQNVTNKGVIRTTAPGGAVIMAAGESVYLSNVGSNVVVQVAMTDPAEHTVDNTGTIEASSGNVGKVVLAAGDIFSTAISGVDSLAAVANRDITLDGNIQAGEIMLEADSDSDGSGDVTTTGTLTSTTGDIEISASDNTIYLGDDVDAAEDLILNDKTEAASNITLKAGDDVFILELLTALGDLAIEAAGGAIEAEAVFMDADYSRLSLTQHDSLNMEQALDDVYNSGNTYLSATSTAGSVTSSKADTWYSIEAQASTFINLNDSDTGGNISTEALTATNGDVVVQSNLGKVYAYGPISAGRDVKITATDESSDAIFLLGYIDVEETFVPINVDAGRDILLNNNTWAADGVQVDAGRDVKVGWDAVHEVYLPKTLTGDGYLWVEAARDITLGGDVTANGDLYLMADYDFETGEEEFHDGVGNMTAKGSVVTTSEVPESDLLVVGKNIQIDGYVDIAGSIMMYGGDNITLGDYVTAGGDIELNANYVSIAPWDFDDGIGDVHALSSIETTDSDLYVEGENIQIEGYVDIAGSIDMYAADSITLGDTVEADGSIVLWADEDDDPAKTGLMWAKSSITTTAGSGGYLSVDGENIQIDGAVDIDGNIDMGAEDSITLGDTVIADGDIGLYADQDEDDDGDVWAKSSITTTDSDLYVEGENIQIDGAVDIAGDIYMYADDSITLGDTIEADGYIGLHADLDDDPDKTGLMWAKSSITTTGTGNNFSAGGENIQIDGAVDIAGYIDMGADDSITLGDTVIADGDIGLYADDDGDENGDVWAKSTITSGGEIDISASDSTIKLDDNVTADEDILLHNNTVVAAGKTLWSVYDDVVLAEGKSITGSGNLTILAGDDIILGVTKLYSHWDEPEVGYGGNVSANGDLTLDAEGSVYAHGTLSTTSGGDIDIYSSDSTTYLWDNVTAAGDVILHNNTEVKAANKTLDAGDDVVLAADRTLDSDYDLTIEADDDIILGVTNADSHWVAPEAGSGGNVSADGKLKLTAADDVYAHGTLTTTSGGDIEIYSSDDTTYLYGDYVNANGSILLNNTTESYGDIIASQDVTLNGTLELKGTGSYADQQITATNGALYANDWVHKTSSGNLDMFGGFEGPWTTAFSVWTNEVRVEGGELSIRGDGSVTMRGPIYSTGNMLLSANDDEDVSTGILHHYYGMLGTIESRDGDVDMSATNNIIYLYGGPDMPADYVSAGGDILLRDDTHINGARKLNAGDDIVLAAGKSIAYNGSGALAFEAGDDIIFGSADVDNHWVDPTAGSPGNVTVAGDLILTAGDDIYAHGKLQTVEDSGGNITATAVDNINLYATPTSADADGTLILTADSDDGLGGDGGDLTVNGALYGNMQLSGVDVTVYGDIVSDDTLDIDADDSVYLGGDAEADGKMTINAGYQIETQALTTTNPADGDIDVHSEDFFTNIYGEVTSAGNLWVQSDDDDVEIYDNIYVTGNATLLSGGHIELATETGDKSTIGGDFLAEAARGIELYGDVEAGGSFEAYAALDAFLWGGSVIVEGDIQAASILLSASDGPDFSYSHIDVAEGKTLTSTTGDITVEAHHNVLLGGDVDSAGNLIILADQHNDYYEDEEPVTHIYGGDVRALGTLNAAYDVYISGNNIDLDEDVVAGGSIELTSGTSHDFTELWWGWDTPYGEMYAGSDLLAGTDVTINGDIVLDEGDWVFDEGLEAWVWDGDQFITAQSGTITAKGEVWKDTPGELTMFGGSPDLAIDLQNPGSLLNEEASVATTGNLYIRGNGDIQIAGDITALGGYYWWHGDYPDIPEEADVVFPAEVGGVSIISENGKIFTPEEGEDGLDNDTLNVTIEGYSDQADGIGVELPLDPDQKAAIVIISKEDLKLGEGSNLSASGMYYTSEEFDLTGIDNWDDWYDYLASLQYKYGSLLEDVRQDFDEYLKGLGYDMDDLLEGEFSIFKSLVEDYSDSIGGLVIGVDDRAAMGLLDEPAIIGGVLRDEGEPFDAAIYLASTGGNVDVSGPVSITSYNILNGYDNNYDYEGPRYEYMPQGAMVIDAYDSVTFGAPFEVSLANGDVGDRLEVVSRITEWLFQAIGRLPYPYVGGPFPFDYTYVLRGAGLGNPAITDGRAWVLEDPTPPAPLYQEAGQAAEELTLGVEGCPVLVAAASAELGIPADTIQVSLANSFALNTNIQPCESCARLLNAAAILSDEDGSRMAAMNQVFNELAPAGAPFTPEVAASIVTAFAGHINDGTQYATAIDYIDAFVRYIAVLDTEMGSPVGDDSIAFVMGKYGTGITASANSNIAAFVATRLESGETFGE